MSVTSSLPYTVSYHRQRSSTARIRDGKIHLRISNLVSRREQERHITELLKKMQNVRIKKERLTLKPVLEEVQKFQIPSSSSSPSDGLGAEGKFQTSALQLSTGVRYEIKCKRGKNRKYKIEKMGETLVVLQPVEGGFDLEQAEEVLWKFLMKDQVPVLEQRLHQLREGWLEESFSTLKLKQVMSRWGSCDKRRGIIMLSVKLLLVEPRMLDYVCVHELAHLRHADHSDLFWDLVAAKMPDWKVQRKRLRQYE